MKSADLNLLIALDALLQEENVSRAAARVGLSTPAMSHALARLRAHVGDPLLVRTGQRMVPTPRADHLRARVEAVVREARDVLAPPPVEDVHTVERTFRIHTSDHLITVLGPDLDRLARAAPGVTLHVMPCVAETPALCRDGTIDLAIGVYDYAPYSELPNDLRIQQLYEDEFTCVVRAAHPRVKRGLTLAQYCELEHVQIAPRGNPGGYVDELLARHGLRRRIARALPYFVAGLALVAETDYLLTCSVVLARRMQRRFGLKLIAPPRELGLEPFQFAQLWHPRNDRDPPHRWLRDIVARAARAASHRTGERGRVGAAKP
ncbi:MAG TPA: LysR family transcriptional regulator [Kofleriaceae bacterium]|nr:LysR family transcriptional regulator [Kofleriaceae bacterium]